MVCSKFSSGKLSSVSGRAGLPSVARGPGSLSTGTRMPVRVTPGQENANTPILNHQACTHFNLSFPSPQTSISPLNLC